MNLLACDGNWTQASGAISCTGTLITVDSSNLSQSGLTIEDAGDLRGETLVLFAVVFGFLALKKALK
ncbi:hypothetical protein D3C81_2221620 [compost metagenome]